MAIGGKSREWNYLDEKLCFELYNTLGSTEKATKELEARGVRNPATKEPPAKMSVWVAAVRYIARNIDEARAAMIEQNNVVAKFDDDFYMWLVNRAATALGVKEYYEWVETNGLNKYVHMRKAKEAYLRGQSHYLKAVDREELAKKVFD